MKIVSFAVILMAVCAVILAPDAAAIETRIHAGREPDSGVLRRPTGPPVPIAPTAVPEGYAPPAGYVLWAVSAYRSVLVPLAFAVEASHVLDCESRWQADAVGDNGRALGRWQLRVDVHGPEMLKLGLDPYDEADRTWYVGNVLWTGRHSPRKAGARR